MNVKRIRTRRDMKQGELASLVGISQGFLCDIEHGYATPSLRVAMKLCKALGVTMTELTRENVRAK